MRARGSCTADTENEPAEFLLAHRQHRHDASPGTPDPGGVSSLCGRGVPSLYCAYIQCRSPFEKSQIVPVRNVTPGKVEMTLPAADALVRNGMSAKCWVQARGSRAEAGLPVRAVQPLRPLPSPSTIGQPCARLDAQRCAAGQPRLHPWNQAEGATIPPRRGRFFVGRPGASRLFGGRPRAGS